MLKSTMKADLIIKNARVIDVFQNEIIEGNIAVKDGIFIGVGDYEDGQNIVDVKGDYVCPTLTDGHVHIESSMVSPAEFLKCLVKRGVSTIIADPHEIANVCGIDGIKYILNETENLDANVYIMLPSCVPATKFETSGANLTAKDYEDLIQEKRVLGLGELMDFVGTVNRDKDILDKIKLAEKYDKIIDGHAPMLMGKGLDDYVLADVKTDHECSTIEEMKERIQRGMYVQLREGTAAKNLENLIKGITKDNVSRCFFCTDDRHPADLLEEGNVDNNLRKAIKLGIDPLDAIKMATINPCQCYNLKKMGAIAPGYKADFFTFKDLKDIHAKDVYISGKNVSKDGKLQVEFTQKTDKAVLSKVNIRNIEEKDIELKLKSDRVNVIQIIKDELITKKQVKKVKLEDGKFKFSKDDDVKKIVVVQRHTGNTDISVGLISGYDIKDSAVGTTVAHDSHNIIAIGDNDQDIVNVVNEIRKIQGGMAVSSKGKILGSLTLDIAGLMSSKDMLSVNMQLNKLLEITRNLGVKEGVDPFMTMSFMALPVIPEIKITDKGLFDVNEFKYIDIEA